MVAQGAHFPLPEGAFAPYELVRELGARPLPAYAVRAVSAPGAKSHLLVAERFAGSALGPDGKDSDFVREARRIATLTSPNLPRVRDVIARGEDTIVYTEYVDGEKLASLWRPDGLPLEIALRVIVDVLSGVATLHNLRDARQQPLKLAHGELSPATIVFGLDGVARVLHAVARRVPGALPDPASVRTMAPEILSGEPHDQRADVYGAGALLWEALSGKPLLSETDPSAVVARVRAGDLPKATVPAGAPWAKDLVEVAAKALSPSPDDRWPNATVMAGELRKAAGLRLAPVSTTAAFAKSAISERAKSRRHALETQAPMQAAPARASVPVPARSSAPASAASPPAPAVAPGPAPAAKAPAPSPRPAAGVVAPPRPAPTAPSPPPPVAIVAAAPPAPPPPVADPAPAPRREPATPQPEPETLSDSDVLVAPGLRAPVADVVELGSDSLLDASDSIPPAPAAASEVVLDPFALAAGPPQPAPAPPAAPPAVALDAHPLEPPPAPPPAPPPTFDQIFSPVVEARPAPPPEPLPESRAPIETDPSLARLSERDAAARRRKVLVLGGVVGLGGLILVLAVVRWATRDTSTHESPRPPAAAQVAPAAPPPTVASTVPPSATAPSAPVPPPVPTPVAAPTVASVAPQSTPPPAPAHAGAQAGAVKPKPPAAPRLAPATPRPKRSKPAFDPNTL